MFWYQIEVGIFIMCKVILPSEAVRGTRILSEPARLSQWLEHRRTEGAQLRFPVKRTYLGGRVDPGRGWGL